MGNKAVSLPQASACVSYASAGGAARAGTAPGYGGILDQELPHVITLKNRKHNCNSI
jgi:hypothetical protein